MIYNGQVHQGEGSNLEQLTSAFKQRQQELTPSICNTVINRHEYNPMHNNTGQYSRIASFGKPQYETVL